MEPLNCTDKNRSNECKRRKIKCNGNKPCQRCGNLNLECQYAPNCCTNGFKDSEEFRQMNAQLSSLQEQVDNLFASLTALRNERNGETVSYHVRERAVSIPPQSSPYRVQSKHPSFRGPTSSAFSLDVAKNTLHSMGYQELGDINLDAMPAVSPPPSTIQTMAETGSQSRTRDPLWALSREEMVRLCRVYEEEMGIMYPVLNIEELIAHGNQLVGVAYSLLVATCVTMMCDFAIHIVLQKLIVQALITSI